MCGRPLLPLKGGRQCRGKKFPLIWVLMGQNRHPKHWQICLARIAYRELITAIAKQTKKAPRQFLVLGLFHVHLPPSHHLQQPPPIHIGIIQHHAVEGGGFLNFPLGCPPLTSEHQPNLFGHLQPLQLTGGLIPSR